ncbi:purine-binding chemotaxis protein CheW [Marinobacterium lutimaris]|uniref:Purine-binding chemotaxis protein CheW n=1 Tax=Marinobacterium lutimaris TaxID=568106 RepID=A0A1H6BCD2_9GAMM|nr:purine-binding chemotaxis protein CheW [Marinobacterium lutimaris]
MSQAPVKVLNCVLLDMHGLKLAVEFERIEGALNMVDLSLAIGGMPDWILGSFGETYSSTHVVDTALWLIPDRYKPEHSQYSEVLILQGRKWALACDGLVKSIQIPMDRVNLNTDKEHRSWLYGTYMDERCAIVDVDQLVEEFEATIA